MLFRSGGLKVLVTAGLVVAAVQMMLLLVLAVPVKRHRPGALRSLSGFLLCWAGLALAAAWLGGVGSWAKLGGSGSSFKI